MKKSDTNELLIAEPYRMVLAKFSRPADRYDPEYSRYGRTQPTVHRTCMGYFEFDKYGNTQFKPVGGQHVSGHRVSEWSYAPDQHAFLIYEALRTMKFAIIGWDTDALRMLKKAVPKLQSLGFPTSFKSEIDGVERIEDVFTRKPERTGEFDGETLTISPDGTFELHRRFDSEWMSVIDRDEIRELQRIGIELDEMEIDLLGPDHNRLTVSDVKRLVDLMDASADTHTYTPLTDFYSEDRIRDVKKHTINSALPSDVFNDGHIYFLNDDKHDSSLCTVKDAKWYTKKTGTKCVVSPAYCKHEFGGGYYLVDNGVATECGYADYWGHMDRKFEKLPCAVRFPCDSLEHGVALKGLLTGCSSTSRYVQDVHYMQGVVARRIDRLLRIGDRNFLVNSGYTSGRPYYDSRVNLGDQLGGVEGAMIRDTETITFAELGRLVMSAGSFEVVDLHVIEDVRIYIATN